MTIQIPQIIAGLVAAMLLALEHVYWPRLFPDAHRIVSYTTGVLTLMTVYTGWAVFSKPSWGAAVIGAWVVVVSGGVAVALCYGLDAMRKSAEDDEIILLLKGKVDGKKDGPRGN